MEKQIKSGRYSVEIAERVKVPDNWIRYQQIKGKNCKIIQSKMNSLDSVMGVTMRNSTVGLPQRY